jgi:hypothetical protein
MCGRFIIVAPRAGTAAFGTLAFRSATAVFVADLPVTFAGSAVFVAVLLFTKLCCLAS